MYNDDVPPPMPNWLVAVLFVLGLAAGFVFWIVACGLNSCP